MTLLDIALYGFVGLVVVVGIVGFVIAITKDDNE